MKQKTFGRYNIIKKVGQGGMGVVYKAFDTKLGRQVALKVIHEEEEDPIMQARERFLIEAKATARLQHPNIIKLHDFGMEQNKYFFTMEFIEGQSLNKVCQNSPLPLKQVVDIMIKVVRAIQYAHEQGVIHRDIKPGNIMIDESNQPKVMDFGLAKVERVSKRLSKTGVIVGTLEYMSPEQVKGKLHDIDARSDVYALGATLYELLTGRTLFWGESTFNLIYKILYKDPVTPSKLNHRIPVDLERICMKALEKDKRHRYQSAGALADDLEKFSTGQKIRVDNYIFRQLLKKVKRYKVLLLFYIILCIVAGVIYYNVQDKKPLSLNKPVISGTYPSQNIVYSAPEYIWTKYISSVVETSQISLGDVIPKTCLVDQFENLYVIGNFKNSVNFGKNWNKDNKKVPMSDTDIFITRINADGGYGWTKVISGLEIYFRGACLDKSNNLYVAGYFKRNVNFCKDWNDVDERDPSHGGNFVTKIYSDGKYGWTKTFTGSDILISIDTQDNLNVLVKEKSGFLIIQTDVQGNYKCSRSAFISDAISMVTDISDNIYITGTFGPEKKFRLDLSGIDIKSSLLGKQGIFITKINVEGKQVWTKFIETHSSNANLRGSLATDQSNNVYVAGVFSESVNFGAYWEKNDIKICAGKTDIFVTKIESSGNYCWTKVIGGLSEENDPLLATDKNNNLYICGNFKYAVDFGKICGTTVDNKISLGNIDVFIIKVYSDESYGWTKRIGGVGYDSISAFAVDRNSNVYMCGNFSGAVNFAEDWKKSDKIDANLNADVFITKIR